MITLHPVTELDHIETRDNSRCTITWHNGAGHLELRSEYFTRDALFVNREDVPTFIEALTKLMEHES